MNTGELNIVQTDEPSGEFKVFNHHFFFQEKALFSTLMGRIESFVPITSNLK